MTRPGCFHPGRAEFLSVQEALLGRLGESLQGWAVVCLVEHRLGHLHQLFGVDEAHVEGGCLGASQKTSVSLLEVLHVARSTRERLRIPRVEPFGVVVELLYVQKVLGEEGLVHVRDLELATRTRFERLGDFDDLVRVEVRPRNCIVGFRRCRLLLKGDCAHSRIELYNPVFLRVGDTQREDACASGAGAFLEGLREPLAIEQVVAEHQCDVVVADELFADDERFSDTPEVGLYVVLDVDSKVGTVTQKTTVLIDVGWGGDDEHVSVAGGDRVGQRVVDAGLVENRE